MTVLNLHEKPLYGLFLEFILDGTWNYIIGYESALLGVQLKAFELTNIFRSQMFD